MKKLIVAIIYFIPMLSYSAELTEITKSIKEICHTPEKGTSTHYKVTAKGNTSLKVRFLGKLGGEAKFSKEEWDGVQRVLRKDVANDRKDYRLCVRTLSPIFLKKYGENKNLSNTNTGNNTIPKNKIKYIKALLLPNKPTDCQSKSNYYLNKNEDKNLAITLNTQEEEVISKASSISIWKDDNFIIIPDGWLQIGTYAPKKGKYFVFTNVKPSRLMNTKDINKKEPVAIIQYEIRRMRKGDNNNHLSDGKFSYFEQGDKPRSIKLSKYFDKSTLKINRDCHYIYYK